MAGCSGDPSADTLTKKSTIPLKISATQVVTKGEDSVLPEGITTGIYVTAKDSTIATSYFENQQYISKSSGELLTDANVDLTIGNSYDIYAYAPYLKELATPGTVEFSHDTDVLWASKATISNVSASNCITALAFEHRTAQVSFNVVFDKDFNAGSKIFTSSSTLEVSGFYSKGTLNLVTGALTPSSTADVSLSAVGTATTGSMTLGIGETCFIPSVSEMTFLVKINHEGKAYNATIKETFVAGSSYNYTISILKTFSTLGITGNLKEWTPVSESATVY